jgi:hypothetical protein
LESGRNRLTRDVVGRAAEPSRDDDDVGLVRLAPHEPGDRLNLVRHGGDQPYEDAEPFEPAGEPRRVRVFDVAGDDLVADGHNGRSRMPAHPASMDDLLERRAYECRLTPDRALNTLDEAETFLRDRGLLTRTADSALPSLFEACHEKPYAPEKPGFGQWPRTKYPWFGRLGARGYPVLAVHRGKSLLVTDRVARLIDPIARAEIRRMEAVDEGWARLLRHLADVGPSELEDLQVELELKPKELKHLRSPLERCGAIVSRSIVYEEPHRHTSALARWDQLYPEPAGDGGLRELVVAAVCAAVVAPVVEIPRWFSWKWYWDDSILDDERLVRIDQYVTSAETASWRAPAEPVR